MVEQQRSIKVTYEGVIVGDFGADIIVNGSVIQLKAAKLIDETHQAQLLNYLRATGLKVGLILNFWNITTRYKTNGLMKSRSVLLFIRVHLCSSVAAI